MKEITRSNVDTIKAELQDKIIVLYGAATAGKQTLQLLSDLKITANFFADDDKGKHGRIVEGLKVLSFDELKILSESKKVAVILSSVFSGSILNKVKTIPVDCYEMYDMLYSECVNAAEECLSMKQDKATWNKKWHTVEKFLHDEESKRVWELIRYVADTKNVVKESFMKICSPEEHYFVKSVRDLLTTDSVLVDCGAYNGDMLGQLANNKIPFGKIYEIEANPFHHEKIVEKTSTLNFDSKVVVINCGLCDYNGEMDFFINHENLAGSRFVESENNLTRGGADSQNPYEEIGRHHS